MWRWVVETRIRSRKRGKITNYKKESATNKEQELFSSTEVLNAHPHPSIKVQDKHPVEQKWSRNFW
jgi:hypothetical protein